MLHLSSWRGRRGSLLHGSAAAAVDVQGSAGGREERNAGRKEERRHGCEGEAALLRGSEGEAAAVLDVGLRGVVMGLLVGWA